MKRSALLCTAFDKIAPAVNGVLGEQLTRLKSLLETGRPAASK